MIELIYHIVKNPLYIPTIKQDLPFVANVKEVIGQFQVVYRILFHIFKRFILAEHKHSANEYNLSIWHNIP